MARVLISFLGTGPFKENERGAREYKKAKYKIDNSFYETPFVSAALTEHLNIEKKIVLGTAKSMWEEYYRYFAKDSSDFDHDFHNKLAEYSRSANHKTEDFTVLTELEEKLPDTKIIVLKYGLNEDELRYNILQVLSIDNLLEKKDGVYIDVTHGFRTFPLLAQQVVFYLKEVSSKNIKIRNFYYGMLEANKDLGYAPVIDLKIMFEMNDWILGANLFKETMNGKRIVSLIQKKDKELSDTIDAFSKALSINYANEIQQQINLLKDFDTSGISNPEKLIIDKVLKEFVLHFSNISSHAKFQFELAKWYYNKYQFGSAYVSLTEAIVTLICEDNKWNPFQKSNREKAKERLHNQKNKDGNKLYPLAKIYNKIFKIRNNISHNLQKRESRHIDDIEDLPKYFKVLKQYFK